MQNLAIQGGFDDPVLGSQGVFRALMHALARPGTVQPLPALPRPPAPLTPELAAVAQTLCDHDTPLWLDPALRDPAVADWLRFNTGAPIVDDPVEAAFALALTLPEIAGFAQGTDEYPDRSTTIVLAVPAFDGGPALTLRGPGIESTATVAPTGLPDDFIAQWAGNRARFPRGVDLLLVSGGRVLGLPRTTRIGGA